MTGSSKVDAFYSRWARLYEFIALRTPGVRRLRRTATQRLQPPASGVVADMGCATGPNFAFLEDQVGPDGAIVGVDVASGTLQRANATVARQGWGNVHVIKGDATRPPIRDADAVFAGFVLGMFERPDAVVERWCDLVGPGGRIALLDFIPSDRWYSPLPNIGLQLMLFVSVPGKKRFRRDGLDLLAGRVEAGHQVLEARCTDREVSTHWGGIVRIHTGTVTAGD